MAAASCLPVDCCWPVIGRMKPILTLLSCAPAPPAATRMAAQAAARKSFCFIRSLPLFLGRIPTFRPGLVQFPDIQGAALARPTLRPIPATVLTSGRKHRLGRLGRSDGQDRARARNVTHADAARF